MNRRALLKAAPGGALLLASGGRMAGAFAKPPKVDVGAILDDPDAPVGGNRDGDTTIVAFLDYNCPYCRRTAPDLKRFVATDGKVKLVYKDWPILAVSSVFGARIALASKFQGKYQDAHDALMGLQGPAAADRAMHDAVASAGVDIDRMEGDLAAHNKPIHDLIARNNQQAESLGLQGTPVYLVGPFLVAAALDYDGFAEVVGRFREHIR